MHIYVCHIYSKSLLLGGLALSANKDAARGTWKVYIRYIDWMGQKQIKTKRGFATKKEALAWERDFLQSQSKDMNMSFL